MGARDARHRARLPRARAAAPLLIDRRGFLGTGAAAAAAALARSRAGAPAPFVPARPSARQLAWQRGEIGIFVHFGINTFTDREWGDGTERPALFQPAALDARQWARAARAAGAARMVLTAKHHDGFCLWPSAHTAHSVRSSPWRGGRGDVVREFVDAARAEGLGAGLYLSPWDRNAPSYGTDAYNDYYVAQLEELLSGYGPIVEVWFDGANGEGPNGRHQRYDWPRFFATVRRLQPGAVIFSDAGPDVRWCGNERGAAGDPNWAAVNPAVVPAPGATGAGVTAELQHGDPRGAVWRPAEADVSIRPGWFWHPAEDPQVKSAAELVALYVSSVGRNAALLLNVPPTRDGRFAAPDAASLEAFGGQRAALFAADLTGAARVTRGRGAVELAWTQPARPGLVALAEDVEHGQTVEDFVIETWTGAAWTICAGGTTIGVRRLERFDPVETTRLRVRAHSSFGAVRLAVVRAFGAAR